MEEREIAEKVRKAEERKERQARQTLANSAPGTVSNTQIPSFCDISKILW